MTSWRVCVQRVVCEMLLAVGEYTRTVMFMWMFIEGFYLHNIIVVTVFSCEPNYLCYYALGWGKSPDVIALSSCCHKEVQQ